MLRIQEISNFSPRKLWEYKEISFCKKLILVYKYSLQGFGASTAQMVCDDCDDDKVMTRIAMLWMFTFKTIEV